MDLPHEAFPLLYIVMIVFDTDKCCSISSKPTFFFPNSQFPRFIISSRSIVVLSTLQPNCLPLGPA